MSRLTCYADALRLYVNNALVCLQRQEDLLIHGDSVYDIVDKQDHQSVQSEMARPPSAGGVAGVVGAGAGDDTRLFLCRMNVSRNARRQMRFGDQKVGCLPSPLLRAPYVLLTCLRGLVVSHFSLRLFHTVASLTSLQACTPFLFLWHSLCGVVGGASAYGTSYDKSTRCASNGFSLILRRLLTCRLRNLAFVIMLTNVTNRDK